jgi:ADP-heptose:LPS heptosyltransferase
VKLLVVRFSSIGDIVLTTPILRALKNQLPEVEIHYLTKKAFTGILDQNPFIDQLITIDQHIDEVIPRLKAENYDYIIDLHKNARSLSLKRKLGVKSLSFPKLNIEKWLLVNFKWNKMPKVHIVDRYFEAVKSLGVKNEQHLCDFFIAAKDEIDTQSSFGFESGRYVSVAVGAQFATKRLPVSKIVEILKKINSPIVLVGGPTDKNTAQEIIDLLPDSKITSACGNFNLGQSASIVKQSAVILTHDTGLMHIATCFKVPIVSVWGNTVPDLGMYPYYPENPELFSIHEVEDLKCRPCSKIGYSNCPKGHFKCMMKQDEDGIAEEIRSKEHPSTS